MGRGETGVREKCSEGPEGGLFSTLARNQGRRPPRIAGPSPGTAIWLLSCSTDNREVRGCHKVPFTEVGSPHHGPAMRGLTFRCERQQSPAKRPLAQPASKGRFGPELPGIRVSFACHGSLTGFRKSVSSNSFGTAAPLSAPFTFFRRDPARDMPPHMLSPPLRQIPTGRSPPRAVVTPCARRGAHPCPAHLAKATTCI